MRYFTKELQAAGQHLLQRALSDFIREVDGEMHKPSCRRIFGDIDFDKFMAVLTTAQVKVLDRYDLELVDPDNTSDKPSAKASIAYNQLEPKEINT